MLAFIYRKAGSMCEPNRQCPSLIPLCEGGNITRSEQLARQLRPIRSCDSLILLVVVDNKMTVSF